jgi:hypothetical protein
VSDRNNYLKRRRLLFSACASEAGSNRAVQAMRYERGYQRGYDSGYRQSLSQESCEAPKTSC